jgi:GT2 family glycosyltransferase
MHDERVFILIVTYNARNWLPLCCPRAEELPAGWTVLAVDNASTDGTPELLAAGYPHVRLIRNKENLGFGQANNQGLRLALDEQAAYVFLLNQDAEIPPNDIKTMIAAHKAHPEYLVISPLQMNGQGTSFDHSFARLLTAELGSGFATREPGPDPAELWPVRQGIAAAWLLPREALTDIGGFNPLFYHYGEDEDYVNRVLYHGGKVGVSPRAAMRHHRDQRNKAKKAVDSRLIDRFIDLANPARPAPGACAIVRTCLRPLAKQLFKGKFSLLAFLFRACRELMRGDAPGSIRGQSRRRGAAFL